MTDIIFAVPRYQYGSYQDLYHLIELSEFPTCFIDEIDPASDSAYIITIYNHEFGDYSGARARICLWDLEYHLEAGNRLPDLPGVEVWASDKWYAEQIGARYVPMGGHTGLRLSADSEAHRRYSASPHRYDVAYLAYMTHRRQHIRNQLIERGVTVSPNGWGAERHIILSNSTAYLNVHQRDDAPTICPLRMVVAAAYGLPVITEAVADAGVFTDAISQDVYRGLAEHIHTAVCFRDTHWHKSVMETGAVINQLLCHDLTFRKSIEAAL